MVQVIEVDDGCARALVKEAIVRILHQSERRMIAVWSLASLDQALQGQLPQVHASPS